jgi:hypothetical protein
MSQANEIYLYLDGVVLTLHRRVVTAVGRRARRALATKGRTIQTPLFYTIYDSSIFCMEKITNWIIIMRTV